MIALVDCNNFYASCERVFRPDLVGRPIVVLSNNDGCVIARSAEAKAIGVPMAVPTYQIEKLVKEHNIQVFSSNYTLYGDMSRRVMSTLGGFAPEIEVYSIDEAFLDLSGLEYIDMEAYGKEIVKKVVQYTGIPIGIGIAPTKTLAKLANRLAKKTPGSQGACVLLPGSAALEEALKNTAIKDIWGVGRNFSKSLGDHGIYTAYDFVNTPREWVRRHMKVIGLRTWEELQGLPCMGMEEELTEKQAICTSRSFGKLLNEYAPLEEAITYYASTCAAKLREQKSCAAAIYVFAYTHPNRPDLPKYRARMYYTLPIATNSTLELVKYARYCLETVYKEKDSKGRRIFYKNGGVVVSSIVPQDQLQANMFHQPASERHMQLMAAMDKINRNLGRETVILGAQGVGKNQLWKLKCEKLSQRYTTRIDDIVEIHAD